MADYSAFTVKILDNCLVSPPSGSVPATTHIPLSFFDIIWLRHPPTRRLFFYKFPHSTAHFTDVLLPSLKQSLSLALQQFFPFSAKLIFPPQPHKPHLLYTPDHDDDSVHLTIAESPDSAHFHSLISDHPKDARDVYQLFQDWPEPRVLSDEITQVLPLLTLQITIFPYEGLSIGVAFLHVAADGPSLHHFIKTWASISARKFHQLDGTLPFHDRTVVPDPHGLESTLLRLHWSVDAPISFETMPVISQRLIDKVRATFLLSKSQIQGLKNWANSKITSPQSPHLSTFVVICSLVWVCFVASVREFSDDGETCCFAFSADCRKRRLGNPIPPGYFGNCLALCYAEAKKSELLGGGNGNGMVVGMKAIGKRVGEVENEPLKDTAEGLSIWKKYVESGGVAVAVGGSPRLGAYDVDYGLGLGRPVKTEVVQIDSGRLFSIGESRDEQKGGIEVGLALNSAHMARFVAAWEQNLNQIIIHY